MKHKFLFCESQFNVFTSDQSGRILAVFLVAPILFSKGIIYNDEFIIIFAVILFLWDLHWLCVKPPKTK